MSDKVSRKALIQGASNIVLGGKSIIQSGEISFPISYPNRLAPPESAD